MSTATSISIPGRKRPLEVSAFSNPTKSRSKLPRRARAPLLPIVDLVSAHASLDPAEEAESSSTCFQSNLSRESKAIGSFGGGGSPNEFRRITRSYSRRTRNSESGRDPKRSMVEVSKSQSALGTETSEVVEGFPGGDAKKKSAASKALGKEREISASSCVGSVTDVIGGVKATTEEAVGRPQISQNSVAPTKEPPRDRDLDSDLACSEGIPNEDDEDETSEFSTCNELTLSETEDLFGACSSEGDFYHDYSLSDLAPSSSSSDGFSEKSHGSVAISVTYSLFLQFARLFLRSSFGVDRGTEHENSQEFTFMSFENEEDEESYRRLRSREVAENVVHDYTEEYSNSTDHGHLIVEQRLVMVNWMVEHSSTMDLHSETLFLGVSLMDHFLSKGYFESQKNLQLLGIACITLATRIEENQPYNSIRQISFKVGNNYYRRSEVVAMEWLVQDVLRFKCFLPTICNFLWFYLKAAKADANVQNLSRYLAILSLLDHERLSFKPSSVAAGLVILACLATNYDDSCQMVMETHVRTKNDDLPECMQTLQWLVKYAR
ncbi:cyclin-SDS-like [Canna indica]|uniref:Cyclin-SDS-like n=1 Tax=Canna indica TaxID=4628 RepID=A0AAQ3KBN3_9LILI|nr:cyclin-SDS-like [Canna indica]